MRVVIAGGHGQIALRLERLLAARGDTAAGLIRDPSQAADLRAAGAEPLLCDLEEAGVAAVAAMLAGADAVVFAAGTGPGSGTRRKDTVDRAAAALLADAASSAGVRRYLMVSAIGAKAAESTLDQPAPDPDDAFAVYLRAKAAADVQLRRRDLDWTILRPGRLTDDPGTGRVRLGPDVPRDDVPRDDVAAVLLALLDAPATAGLDLSLVSGDVPATEAVAALL